MAERLVQALRHPIHRTPPSAVETSGRDRAIPGLDVARLTRDVNSPEVNARVDRDLKEFRSNATPEFVLNGRFFQGQVSEAQLKLLIDEAAR